MSPALFQASQREFDDAVAWQAEPGPGLGDAVLVEVLRVSRLIERHPEAWHRLSEHARRCRLARSPYGVI